MMDILRERMNGAGEGAGGLSGQEDAEEKRSQQDSSEGAVVRKKGEKGHRG